MSFIRVCFHRFIQVSRLYSTQKDEIRKIRNIGIIAHIDAGKTTTTERMLYYSGKTLHFGEVHDGDTVTDYLQQERERGITITSASISFPWKEHKINLLDTPGHIDFIVEVERCLSVLDSAITILDASAGVEAQTFTIWEQATRYNLPRIVYLNKMDKKNANIEMCLAGIKSLDCKPLLINAPIMKDKNFSGLIDVITMQSYTWPEIDNDGSKYLVQPFEIKSDKNTDIVLKLREELIGSLTDFDEKLSNIALNFDCLEIPSIEIINALRRSVIKNQVVPILIGSSYKNIGVQVLMDSIIKFLPSPIERPNILGSYYHKSSSAFLFKIIHHPKLGALYFIRVYSGKFISSRIYNVTQGIFEKINKIYQPFADEFTEIKEVYEGSIVAISGLQQSITGDILIDKMEIKEKSDMDISNLIKIKVPEPVFFCSIEAPTLSKQKLLEKALTNLQKEDPSLSVIYDSNTNQSIIKGMGELHIEIVVERIAKEYGFEPFVGPLQISYRETINNEIYESISVNRNIASKNNMINAILSIHPDLSFTKPKLVLLQTQENNLQKLSSYRIKAIQKGLEIAFKNGPLLDFPIIGVEVQLHEFETTTSTSSSFISASIADCLIKALKKSSPMLVQPIMKLEILVPNNYAAKVSSDLTRKGAEFGETKYRNDYQLIQAFAPLANLISYSKELRTLTSGMASLSMILNGYQKLNSEEQDEVIKKVKWL